MDSCFFLLFYESIYMPFGLLLYNDLSTNNLFILNLLFEYIPINFHTVVIGMVTFHTHFIIQNDTISFYTKKCISCFPLL